MSVVVLTALRSACSLTRGVDTAIVAGMTRRQIPRGTRVASARLSLIVEEERKRRFDQIAAQAGMSSAGFFEAVVAHLEEDLSDRGVPNWLPQPEPHDGELPISDVA